MDSYNQSSGLFSTSNGTFPEEVPLFAIYLSMVVVLVLTIVVVHPAVVVINVIWQTSELHTKYCFFVANLLATDIFIVIARLVVHFVIIIVYPLGSNTDDVNTIMELLVTPIFAQGILITLLMPVTLAIECIIVIGFPYRHRSIMTTEIVISILAVMWGLSLLLAIIITIVVSVDIEWPLGKVNLNEIALPFFWLTGLASAIIIAVINVFLGYKVFVSNRKAEKNERLAMGNEEVKRFQKPVQVFRTQAKPTITLLLVGAVAVMVNILIIVVYIAVNAALDDPGIIMYLEHFLAYPLGFFLLASPPLIYGLYMKKTRRRLPNGSGILKEAESPLCISNVNT